MKYNIKVIAKQTEMSDLYMFSDNTTMKEGFTLTDWLGY